MEKNTQPVHILLCCIWGSLPAKAGTKTSKQVPVACGIDPGIKVGLHILVSCVGVCLCCNKIPFGVSNSRVNSVGLLSRYCVSWGFCCCLVCALHFADHGMQKWFMCWFPWKNEVFVLVLFGFHISWHKNEHSSCSVKADVRDPWQNWTENTPLVGNQSESRSV